MEKNLNQIKVAILVTDGFEQVELTDPQAALNKAGAKMEIVSIQSGKISGWHGIKKGDDFNVDNTVNNVDAEDYDALFIPGGIMNPDKLRRNKDAVNFVKDFFNSGKPIAAICHGPWMLIEADVVKGLKCTSFESIKTDMINAGCNWVDEEVVSDQGIITSRKPADLNAFKSKMISEFAEGVHKRRAA